MSIFKNRIVLAVISICLAALFCFLVLPKLSQSQSKTETIASLTQDVKAGTTITAGMVTSKTVGSYGLANDVVKDSADVIGKVAVKDLSKRNNLYKDDTVTTAEYSTKYSVQSKLTSGSQLVALSVKKASMAVAGEIDSDSTVDVTYAHTEQVTNADGTETHEQVTVYEPDELKNMTVYAVVNSDLQTKEKAEAGGKTFIPADVILVANTQQAKELIGLEYSSKDNIHLLLDGTSKSIEVSGLSK